MAMWPGDFETTVTNNVLALRDLIHICLMKELGIKGKPIERILENNASIIWADMDAAT